MAIVTERVPAVAPPRAGGRERRVFDCAVQLQRDYGHLPALASLRRPEARRGGGVTIGLVETALHAGIADLRGARLMVRRFVDSHRVAPAWLEHGTHSVTLIAAQGHRFLRGLVPGATLVVALVADDSGCAPAGRVAEAIDWLVAAGADLIALPLGHAQAHPALDKALSRAAAARVGVHCAAGNLYPEPVLYPARHLAAVAVGALTRQGLLREECCRLPRLDLGAPGSDVPALVAEGRVETRSGSSVACVVSTALAALAISEGRAAAGPPAPRVAAGATA